MISNIFFIFDFIYKLFKLQFCIISSLIIGLFIFSLGPTLYATSAIIDEIIRKENSSVVRVYYKNFFEAIKSTTPIGIGYIAFIISSFLFAYNIRVFLGTSTLSVIANIYYMLILVAILSLYIYVSIIRRYDLRIIEAIKQSFKIIIKVPFVPLFIVLWSIACSVMFSQIIGLYIMIGFSVYFAGVFAIINIFLKENEEAISHENR